MESIAQQGEPEITMTHATPAVKAPKTTGATRCARCNHVLDADVKHTVTPLGVVGPECEKHVAAALMHLRRNGLHQIANTGEIRFAGIRYPDGSIQAPSAAIQQVQVFADRIGLQTITRFEPATREFVISIARASITALLKRRAQGMQA